MSDEFRGQWWQMVTAKTNVTARSIIPLQRITESWLILSHFQPILTWLHSTVLHWCRFTVFHNLCCLEGAWVLPKEHSSTATVIITKQMVIPCRGAARKVHSYLWRWCCEKGFCAKWCSNSVSVARFSDKRHDSSLLWGKIASVFLNNWAYPSSKRLALNTIACWKSGSKLSEHIALENVFFCYLRGHCRSL